ncbi:MAG: 5-(carboxyamino)imidazole ribonucleotide synthase [Acidimicrobiia bacterium]|nr:5-(carboxyamino)imidazole ribonucleotide synthase [Acidimicrobiia bacterium]
MTDPLPGGSVIGILGGGQLGRMLSVAAARLGFRCHIYEPGANPPAAHVAARTTTAPYDDHDALLRFAGSVDVVTYEFENVPADALDVVESSVPIRPNREALRISQDRLIEKDFLTRIGLNVAPYAAVEDAATMTMAIAAVGTPSILKTRRFGYDGKGQVPITDDSGAAGALTEVGGAPSILEGFVAFGCEISVIAARSISGNVVCFDPGENEHRDGILRTTTVPASIQDTVRTDAVRTAGLILDALEYVGVLGVELFVTTEGLLVNEIAPRVHNSGHWTQNGCAIDQFEQHIRAITGWPLGDGRRHVDVVMENLIGDDIDRVPGLAIDPAASLHLYGKADTKPGRKMGHVNRIVRPVERYHSAVPTVRIRS